MTHFTKSAVSILVCALALGCAGKAPETNVTSPPEGEQAKSEEATPEQWYDHHMSEAAMAVAEERLEDALDSYLAAAKVLEDAGEVTVKRADAHYAAAELAYQRMKKDLAVEQYEKSIEIFLRFSGNSKLKGAVALTNLGVIYKEKADRSKARNCWEQAIQIYKEAGDSGQNKIRMQKVEQNIRDLDEGF